MLPIVAKRKLKLKAAKIEAYIIFHPGKSTVACTSPSQISEVLCSKTLNIWHDLRSSFWKRFFEKNSIFNKLWALSVIHWTHCGEYRERGVEWSDVSWVSFGYIPPFTHFFLPVHFQAPIPWSAQYSLSVLLPGHTAVTYSCVVTAIQNVHYSLLSCQLTENKIQENK